MQRLQPGKFSGSEIAIWKHTEHTKHAIVSGSGGIPDRKSFGNSKIECEGILVVKLVKLASINYCEYFYIAT